ncbi:MAG: electron transfer flavoprotein subunit alpha/FixB family protein [Bacteroidota bacterium]
MKIVAFAEQRDGKFKQSAFEVVRTGRTLAAQLGGECCAIVVGTGVTSIAAQLGGYGVSRVVVVDDTRLKQYSTTAYAKAIATVVQKEQAAVVLLTASSMGKDLSPRVAVQLDAGLAPDCTALNIENGEIVATRPAYAGKVLLDVKVTSAVKVFTLRPNVFAAGTSDGQSAAVENIAIDFADADFAVVVNEVRIAEGRPDVTEANIVVSGGRGMKGPEHFHLIEKLADILHGAVGASRAVVDAKWRPHDEQVGQTGKTVSPSLYIACGISGAIQHIAGMSSSKFIVAINKDKDAPIFQIADYGIVGDALEILPVLTQEIKQKIGT